MSKSKPLESQEDAYKVIKDDRRHKKESNDKKKSKSKHTDAEAASTSPEIHGTEPTANPPKKRKRETLPEEIEVDITLPEPASKKAARKAKKAKTTTSTTTNTTTPSADNATSTTTTTAAADSSKRSTHGVWIGNLPWSATKETLTTFLTTASDSIPASSITRIHMPAPKAAPRSARPGVKPQNRGFAYVDLATPLAQYAAIGLTETQLDGRALLIKDARNFEGRPEKPRAADGEKLYGAAGSGAGAKGGAAAGEKAPSRKVFVGNLAFETTREDLEAHFAQCGAVLDVHMATFEDSGKSKGFAWVTFAEVEAATAAVDGFVYKYVEEVVGKRPAGAGESDDDDDEAAVPKSRKRKWKLNRLMGRELRCEFAEDSTTRYQKRFGKGEKPGGTEAADGYAQRKPRPFESRAKPSGKPFQPKGKVDPRTIKPGAAHANAPRASAAIVESTGKKTTFE